MIVQTDRRPQLALDVSAPAEPLSTPQSSAVVSDLGKGFDGLLPPVKVNMEANMNLQTDRRLLQASDISALLQLEPEQIDHLVATGQIQSILICGQVRFDSREINRLIETYLAVSKRKNSAGSD